MIYSLVSNLVYSCCIIVTLRYGHASVMLPSGDVLLYGGFGCRDQHSSHGRLDTLVRLELTNENSVVVEDVVDFGTKPTSLFLQ